MTVSNVRKPEEQSSVSSVKFSPLAFHSGLVLAQNRNDHLALMAAFRFADFSGAFRPRPRDFASSDR